jgi:hypothetical protein
MKRFTQEQIILNQLKEHGFVTRNWALQNFISRLGAIICDLNQDGYVIHGDWIKTENGKDYKYTLVEEKVKKIEPMYVKHPLTGERITTAEYALL